MFQTLVFPWNHGPLLMDQHSTKQGHHEQEFYRLVFHLQSLEAYKNLWQINSRLVDLSIIPFLVKFIKFIKYHKYYDILSIIRHREYGVNVSFRR